MNESLPLVSVITVCLNSGKTIRQTIESVLNQTYPNIEYIIIDGQSTDDTIDIINEYQYKIAHFVSEKDKGISDALGKGIRMAKGEFIQFIHADDCLPENKISKSVEILLKNPSSAFVYGDVVAVNRDTQSKLIPGNKDYARTIHYVMKRLNHPTMLLRRVLFEKYGMFDLKWKIAMDYEWHLRIHRAGERGIYSREIFVYMKSGGISDKNALQAFKEVRNISISYGFNKYLAYGYYLLRLLKHHILVIIGKR